MAPLIFLKDTLTDRMGLQPILPIKVSITIDTMLHFDSDFDGQSHGDVDVTCKQTFRGLCMSFRYVFNTFTSTVNSDKTTREIKSAAIAIVNVQCEKVISVTIDCATSFGLSCNNTSYVSIVIEIVIHGMSISSLIMLGTKILL